MIYLGDSIMTRNFFIYTKIRQAKHFHLSGSLKCHYIIKFCSPIQKILREQFQEDLYFQNQKC
jgi:hypothetical protein